MKKSKILKVELEYNYIFKIKDSDNGYIFNLRDITGSDLEFYERFFDPQFQDEPFTFENKMSCLQLISDIRLRNIPYKKINKLFNIALEFIFCNYIDKYTWLKYCHAIQNGRIYTLELEKEPMIKFLSICQIHSEYVSAINSK